MKTEAFCRQVVDQIDHGALPVYRDVLFHATMPSIRDPFWQAAAHLAHWLGPQEQALLLALMRRAAIDASAALLGAIDGGDTPLAQAFAGLWGAEAHPHHEPLRDVFLRLAGDGADPGQLIPTDAGTSTDSPG